MFKKKNVEKSVSDDVTRYMNIHMVDGSSFSVLYTDFTHGVYSREDDRVVYAVMNNDLLAPSGRVDPSQLSTYGRAIELRGIAEHRVFLNPAHIVSVQGDFVLSPVSSV